MIMMITSNIKRANKMTDSNIIPNQERVYLHIKLADDLAYQYSVNNSDVMNMQMVLRAHGESHNYEDAENQIKTALEF